MKIDTDTLRSIFDELHNFYIKRNLLEDLQKGFTIYPDDIMQNDNYIIDFLKRTCLYCDKIILNDYLYGVVHPVPVFDTFQRCRPKSEEQIRQDLSGAISSIIKIKELIEDGLVILTPIGGYLQKVNASISALSMNDLQNPQFREICLKNIRSKISTEGSNKNLMVTMGSSDGEWVSNYGTSGDENLEDFKNRLIEALIFAAAYDINKTLHISTMSNAKIVSGFELYWNLLNKKFGNVHSNIVIESLLRMDLKFLDNIPFSEIVKFRNKNSSTFEDFRIKLEEVFREINEITLDQSFSKKVKDIQRRQIDPEIRRLDREFSRIKSNRLLRGASIAVAGVIGSYFSGGISVAVSSGVSLIKEYADYLKDKDKLKENSMYFLWKIKKK